MVACTYRHLFIFVRGIIDIWQQFCCCAIYLFFILMKWQQKHSSLAVIALGFLLFYFFYQKQWMLLPVAVAFMGFLIGKLGYFIHLSWMMLAKVLGYMNSRILLTVLFFVVLTPIALVKRFFTASEFTNSKKINSAFQDRGHLYSKQDLINTW